ncbi:hypothetical protein [Rhizobium sp. EC-SD404]|uniref:hypothetical protein n=1 Tax=Rhizobium sp. EC-SD404 TaxID=2038389 RepID=UPI00125B0CF2|nr:hypothetical protein [Rhizobium sp. EC-SD404]VVT04756.1 hypothetical protein RHIZ404_200283 [Rhizobium sp. EC-SD404]
MMDRDASPDRTFEEGFEDGYKFVAGSMVLVPLAPLVLVPLGYTDYAYGYKKGAEAAATKKR